MEDSGESRPGERGVPSGRRTWFAKQLGEGWTEVEPGIYRFNPGVKNEAGIRMAPRAEQPLDNLIEAFPAERR